MKLLKIDGSILIEGNYVSVKELLEKNRGLDLRDAYLRGSDLRGAYLRGAYLRGAYLRGAYLRGAYLEGANLEGANLEGAYLEGAYLEGAYLEGADLRGSDLRGAYLRGAYLEGAYLEGADLRGADLRGAYLRGAYLRGAKYGDIEIKNTIITITNLDYFCLIFSGYIKLGCELYKVEEWESFSDDEIIKMDGKKAIKFWKKWKNALIEMCKEENEPQEE